MSAASKACQQRVQYVKRSQQSTRPNTHILCQCYDGTCANAMVSEPMCTPASTTVLPVYIWLQVGDCYYYRYGERAYVHPCLHHCVACAYIHTHTYKMKKGKEKSTFIGWWNLYISYIYIHIYILYMYTYIHIHIYILYMYTYMFIRKRKRKNHLCWVFLLLFEGRVRRDGLLGAYDSRVAASI